MAADVPKPPAPIFVIGMMRRTGTNYLADLLALHPACTTRAPIREDYLLARAHHLVDYVEAVERAWTPSWGVPPEEPSVLLRSLGDGIVEFLTAGSDGRHVVTKTPNVANLDRFFDLFPHAHLLVLVRDGRNVVESLVRSGFTRTHEAAMRDWATAARVVISFDERNRDRGMPYRLVRYDDLVRDLHGELHAILETCRLDAAEYDFAAAARLPVRGSSSVRAAAGEVHWRPEQKGADFAPLDRWRGWDESRLRRFARLAGAEQRALGFAEPEDPDRSPDRLADFRADLLWSAHLANRFARHRLAPAVRALAGGRSREGRSRAGP